MKLTKVFLFLGLLAGSACRPYQIYTDRVGVDPLNGSSNFTEHPNDQVVGQQLGEAAGERADAFILKLRAVLSATPNCSPEMVVAVPPAGEVAPPQQDSPAFAVARSVGCWYWSGTSWFWLELKRRVQQ